MGFGVAFSLYICIYIHTHIYIPEKQIDSEILTLKNKSINHQNASNESNSTSITTK